MEEKLNKQNIERLDISDNAINILKSNSIKTIGQLRKKTRKDLKSYDMLQNDINKIEVELELLGLNLKDSI